MRINNSVLLEKIKNSHSILLEIKEEVKQNTEFRQKATGIIGVVSFMSAGLGALILKILTKVWK